MIHIYYGNGQGKTCASIGLGMRAYGAGLSVSIVRFLKSNSSSELNSLPFKIFESPDELGFNPGDEYRPWIDSAAGYIKSCSDDVIILDEFLDVIPKFISVEDALNLIEKDCEIIISGHKEVKPLFDRADYITYFENIRHPYDKNQKARIGFEY